MRLAPSILLLLVAALGPATGSALDERGLAIAARIRESIEASRLAGELPYVVVDIDDTAAFASQRFHYVLTRYDREHGTRLFEGLGFRGIPGSDLEAFLRSRLPPLTADAGELERRVADILRFNKSVRYTREALLEDLANPDLVELTREWREAGARIAYVTGRHAFQEKDTADFLAASGLAADELHVHDHVDDRTDQMKVRRARAILEAESRARIVAFLDNEIENVETFRDAFPATQPILVDIVHDAARATSDTRLFDLRARPEAACAARYFSL